MPEAPISLVILWKCGICGEEMSPAPQVIHDHVETHRDASETDLLVWPRSGDAMHWTGRDPIL